MDDKTPNLAVFLDYDNLAIGTREAGYGALDIGRILERLLDKGRTLLRKAYADWRSWDGARRPLHEAGFELVEIPHTSYAGKNSADIRLVVDALDLCHTKPHVDLFVIGSGDSDFSPLVAKLRENAKRVLGVGVKSSTSDLLVEGCDEFIYYDDLVREAPSRRGGKQGGGKKARQRDGGGSNGKKGAGDKDEALDLLLDTVESLFRERGEAIWGSHVKQVIQRKRPHFSEGYYGYRSFNELLEDAQAEDLLEMKEDERSGGYRILDFGAAVATG